MYNFGIDIGGTFIKAGIVKNGKVLVSAQLKTNSNPSVVSICVSLYKNLIENFKITPDEITSVGIGIPGAVNKKNKEILYMPNLELIGTSFASSLAGELGTNVFIENDANCAAIGEYLAGASIGAKSSITLTLGTGIGGGFILEGKLYSGFNDKAGEIGHMVIKSGGEVCNCGRSGCFERYASWTAFLKISKDIEQNQKNEMFNFEIDKKDKVLLTKYIFENSKNNPMCIEIVNKYISYLSEGICNLINIFDPEVIVIAGGVSMFFEYFGENLKKIIRKNIYSKNQINKEVKILKAALGVNSGVVGASLLENFNQIS